MSKKTLLQAQIMALLAAGNQTTVFGGAGSGKSTLIKIGGKLNLPEPDHVAHKQRAIDKRERKNKKRLWDWTGMTEERIKERYACQKNK